MQQPKKGDLVLVEWDDIQTDSGWKELDENVKPAECKSVGFVTVVRPRYVVLAGMLGLEPDTKDTESNARQCIPWGCVRHWRPLRPGRAAP